MAVRHSTDGCPRHRMAASNSPSCRFAPSKSSCRRTIEERVFVYGVFGGTPRYLSPLDPSQSLERTSRGCCATRMAGPRRAETVLQMELNEVNTYFFGSESMASGNRSRNEIAQGSRHREHQHVVLLRPAGNPPDHRETSSGTRRSGAQQADSIQDSRSRIPVDFPVSLRPRGAVRTLRRERLRGSHRTGIARLRQRNVRIALSPGGTGALCRLPAHTGAKPVVVQGPGGRCRRTN